MGTQSSWNAYEWPDESYLKKVSSMNYKELWFHIFGSKSKSEKLGETLRKRVSQEIRLAAREIVLRKERNVNKPKTEQISDLLNRVTLGLCVFPERFFPKEWALENDCCVQQEFFKNRPEGKHTVIVKSRLYQVQIVLKKSECDSMIGNFIPSKLEEDSEYSAFHNANRFYQNFLESVVQCSFGYNIKWLIEDNGCLEQEIEWFENNNSSETVDFESLKAELKLKKERKKMIEREQKSERKRRADQKLIEERQLKKKNTTTEKVESDSINQSPSRDEKTSSQNVTAQLLQQMAGRNDTSQKIASESSNLLDIIRTERNERWPTKQPTEIDIARTLSFVQTHKIDFDFCKGVVSDVIRRRAVSTGITANSTQYSSSPSDTSDARKIRPIIVEQEYQPKLVCWEVTKVAIPNRFLEDREYCRKRDMRHETIPHPVPRCDSHSSTPSTTSESSDTSNSTTCDNSTKKTDRWSHQPEEIENSRHSEVRIRSSEMPVVRLEPPRGFTFKMKSTILQKSYVEGFR